MSSPPRNPLPALLPWLLAGIVLFVVAAVGGYGAAYLLTSSNAVPTVDPSRLPTPTPRETAVSTTAPPSPGPSATPSAAPSTPAPTSTAEPTESGEPSPESTPIRYVVKPGDRLSRIATQFGVTVEEIVQLNDLENPDRIVVGQVLLIPVH